MAQIVIIIMAWTWQWIQVSAGLYKIVQVTEDGHQMLSCHVQQGLGCKSLAPQLSLEAVGVVNDLSSMTGM